MTAAWSWRQPASPNRAKKGRTHIFAGSPATDPEHAFDQRVDNDRRIAVALLNRELVQGNHLHSAEVDRAELLGEMSLVDALYGVPAQLVEISNVLDGKHRTESSDPFGQAARDP
jgi:hypothetical protein